jgi:UTP-glucose-1-phosphate uridylyltransferase
MYAITKSIDKAMLPIGTRPAIDLIVGECQAAGVDQIAVVVRAGPSTSDRSTLAVITIYLAGDRFTPAFSFNLAVGSA